MAKTSAGAALAARLGALGVDYIFANSGTDFPPVIEGLAEAAAKGMTLPRAVTVPHESAAMAMAHGYTLATGRPQAVMVHTNVGLANAAIGAINARADNVPMLVFSGRTPSTEKGRFGSRTVPIGWGQEMLDQHALVREACKWDYELRFPEQIAELTDRAHGIACSVPRGPVYLSLPREVLCEVIEDDAPAAPSMQPAMTMARPEDIARAAQALATARNPVIFAQRGAGSSEAFAALTRMAESWAIPVCQYWAVQLAIPTDHPMATAPDPAPLLAKADVVLVLDCMAPWQPDHHAPRGDALVIQMGQDPLFAQTPVRNFRSDLSLPGDLAANVLALTRAMGQPMPEGRAARFHDIAAQSAAAWQARDAACAGDADGPHLTKRWISARLADLACEKDATIFAELGAQLPEMRLRAAHSWFESPHSGGLGFGLPAAMGYKLATDRLVIATMGDGSCMFANPVACLQVARALDIALLVVVLNNAEWGAVRHSVEALYPQGYAAKSNQMPLTDLQPSPDYAQVAQACGLWGRKVAGHAAFVAALDEAVRHVDSGQGLALIEAAVARS